MMMSRVYRLRGSGVSGGVDGRVRYWGFVPRRRRWLRVITLEDGQTVLNAFWERRFRP